MEHGETINTAMGLIFHKGGGGTFLTSSTSILRRTDLKLYRVDSANQPPTRTRLFLFGGADAAFSFSASLNGEEEPVDGSKAAKVIKLEKKEA